MDSGFVFNFSLLFKSQTSVIKYYLITEVVDVIQKPVPSASSPLPVSRQLPPLLFRFKKFQKTDFFCITQNGLRTIFIRLKPLFFRDQRYTKSHFPFSYHSFGLDFLILSSYIERAPTGIPVSHKGEKTGIPATGSLCILCFKPVRAYEPDSGLRACGPDSHAGLLRQEKHADRSHTPPLSSADKPHNQLEETLWLN